jgi:hypothetical protein
VDLDTFIMVIYCLVDELMGESLPDGERLRARGPASRRSGGSDHGGGRSVLGDKYDEGLHAYFRRHYAEWVSALQQRFA